MKPNNMKKIIYSSIGFLTAIVFLFGLVYMNLGANRVNATAVAGNECNATTTDSTWTTGRTLTTGTAALCFVNITATGATSVLTLYDATTTDIINGNSTRAATSSIIVAKWPVGTTMGAFPFEVQLKYGLIVEVSSAGTGNATATIGFRK